MPKPHRTPMTKAQAMDLLGGPNKRAIEVAKAIGITGQAVSGWPEILTEKIEDRVLAAVARKAKAVRRHKASA